MEIKKIFANANYHLISNILNKLLYLGLILTILRFLGSGGLGKFSFVFAFVGFLGVFLQFGMFTPSIRALSPKDKNFNGYVSSILVLKVFTSLTFCFLVLLVLKVSGSYGQFTWGILIIGLSSIISNFANIFSTIYVAYQKMVYLLINPLLTLVLLISAYALLSSSGSINALFLAFLGVSIMRFIVLFLITMKRFPKIVFSFDFKKCTSLTKSSYLFVLIGLGTALFYNVDILFLTKLTSFKIVGLYEFTLRIINFVVMIPGSLVFAAFPSMTLLYTVKKKAKLVPVFRKILKYSLYVALPGFAGLVILSKKIITQFMGPSFAQYDLALKLFFIYGLLLTLHMVIRSLLYALKKEKVNLYALLMAGALNIVLNLMLIPRYGLLGCAFATLVSYAVVVLMNFVYISRTFCKIGLIKLTYKSVFASVLMGIMVFLVRDVNLFLLIPVGIVIYLTVMLALGELRDEFELLWGYVTDFLSR